MMVSSGISGNIISNFPVDNQAVFAAKPGEADFGMIMSQSMASGSVSGQQSVSTPVQNKQKEFSSDSRSDDNVKTQDSSKGLDEKVKNTDNSSEKGSAVSKSDNRDDAKTTDKNTAAKVQDVIKKIKDSIAEEFEVSYEKIENALMALGFTMADLLDETNFTDFVVELTGMESSLEILTDADMNSVLMDMNRFIGEVTEELETELGITDEELENLLSKIELPEGKENSKQVSVEVLTGESDFVRNVKSEKNPVPQEKYSDMPENDENTVKVDVSDETGISSSSEKEDKGASFGRDTSQTNVRTDFNDVSGNVVNNLSDALKEVFEASGVNEVVDAAKIMEQIVETARVTLNQETTTMEMMLNPENLGKVNLNVSVKEGVVTATITAQNEAVKSAIENQVVMLKENLNNQGLKVEAVEVTVESHAFEAGTGFNQNSGYNSKEQEQNKGNRPLRLDSLSDLVLEQLTDDEKIVLDMMQKEGNQVNFTA